MIKNKRTPKKFGAANADYQTIFGKMDIVLLEVLIPKIPLWLETNHFTLLSLPLALANIGIGFLVQSNILYALLFILTISFNHTFDLLDGAIGRHRNTGFILWGFYMDKIVDFWFLASLCVGLAIAFSGLHLLIFCLFIVFSSMFFHAALFFGATGTYQKNYQYLGFTELKFTAIGIAIIAAFGGEEVLKIVLTVLLLCGAGALASIVYKSQKLIWIIDQQNKQKLSK
jgi:phosphatidylglycerophosphate synthase